jgi:pimeloyl-ACP methyl ester carboxylesterase
VSRSKSAVEVVDRAVSVAGGRVLTVQEGGRRDGYPVLVHAGSPSSRHLYGAHLRDAHRQGIRLFAYDRPGYGGSDPQQGRVVADCAADVSAVADALGIERFAVWGISAGGAHALACASVLPDRVAATSSLASPAPYDAQGLDYFAGIGDDNREDAKLMLTDPAAARAKFAKQREAVLAATASDLLAMYPTLLAPPDRAVLNGELANYYTRRDKDSLARGIEGWWDDTRALIKPWGFTLSGIRGPVLLWHGRQDRFVPFQHAECLAERIPGVQCRLTDEDGHLTLFQDRVPAVHSWLLAQF